MTLSKLEQAKALAKITNILSDDLTALINVVNFKKKKKVGEEAGDDKHQSK
jgi:hypothetical protein